MNQSKSLFHIIVSIFVFSFIGASAEEIVCENKEPKKKNGFNFSMVRTLQAGRLRFDMKN